MSAPANAPPAAPPATPSTSQLPTAPTTTAAAAAPTTGSSGAASPSPPVAVQPKQEKASHPLQGNNTNTTTNNDPNTTTVNSSVSPGENGAGKGSAHGALPAVKATVPPAGERAAPAGADAEPTPPPAEGGQPSAKATASVASPRDTSRSQANALSNNDNNASNNSNNSNNNNSNIKDEGSKRSSGGAANQTTLATSTPSEPSGTTAGVAGLKKLAATATEGPMKPGGKPVHSSTVNPESKTAAVPLASSATVREPQAKQIKGSDTSASASAKQQTGKSGSAAATNGHQAKPKLPKEPLASAAASGGNNVGKSKQASNEIKLKKESNGKVAAKNEGNGAPGNSTGKPKARRSYNTSKSLTMNELSQYFHLPINDVAQALGLCVTVLKQRCRENGIDRWPYRKVRKLDNLITALEKPEGEAAPETPVGQQEVPELPDTPLSDDQVKKKLNSVKETREFLLSNPNSRAHLKLGKLKSVKRAMEKQGKAAAVAVATGQSLTPRAGGESHEKGRGAKESGRDSDKASNAEIGRVRPIIAHPIHGDVSLAQSLLSLNKSESSAPIAGMKAAGVSESMNHQSIPEHINANSDKGYEQTNMEHGFMLRAGEHSAFRPPSVKEIGSNAMALRQFAEGATPNPMNPAGFPAQMMNNPWSMIPGISHNDMIAATLGQNRINQNHTSATASAPKLDTAVMSNSQSPRPTESITDMMAHLQRAPMGNMAGTPTHLHPSQSPFTPPSSATTASHSQNQSTPGMRPVNPTMQANSSDLMHMPPFGRDMHTALPQMVSYVANVAAAAAVLATTSHLQQHSDVALTPTQTGAVTSSAAAAAAAAAAAIQPLCLMGMPYMLSMGNYNFNAPNSSMQTLFSPTPRDIEASRDPVAVPLKQTEMPSTRVKAKDATKANAADSGVINPKASKKAPISESANQEPGAKLDDNKSVPTKSGTEDTNGNPSLPPGKMKADYASKNGKGTKRSRDEEAHGATTSAPERSVSKHPVPVKKRKEIDT